MVEAEAPQRARTPRLSRIAFPRRTLVVAAGTTIAIIAAFAAGRLTVPGDDDVLTAATATVTATAKVELRVVAPEIAMQGTVTEGTQLAAMPPVLPERPIVTRQQLHPGVTVQPGMLLGAIADTPLFAVSGPLPLFRDLAAGDQGDDVAALQLALVQLGFDLEPDGEVRWSTLSAVAELFDDAGYSLPQRPAATAPNSDAAQPGGTPTAPPAPSSEPVIPASAFLAIPAAGAHVLAVAAVADTLGEGTPFATLRTTDRCITARVDAGTAAQLTTSTPMEISAPEARFDGVVTAIGAFDQGGEGRIPGHDVTITTAAPEFEDIATGTRVQLTGSTGAEPRLAVPITALRHDADGDYVLVAAPDRTPARVPVTIITSGGGWAAVNAAGLAEGDTVLL